MLDKYLLFGKYLLFCLKLTIATLEKGMKRFSKLTIKTPESQQ